jgi:hypothetical protein
MKSDPGGLKSFVIRSSGISDSLKSDPIGSEIPWNKNRGMIFQFEYLPQIEKQI